jgi:DNA-binding transcriptional LysR family regulator
MMQFAPQSASGSTGEGSASLAIGCFASIGRDRLGDQLLRFARAWPDVDIGVHEMPRAELIAGVRDGTLELAVMPGEAQPDLHGVELWRDEVVIAMAPGHRLAFATTVKVADLRDERFLISRQEHGGEMHRFLAGRVAPLTPVAGTLCNMSLPRLIDLVAADQGLAFACASHAPLLGERVAVRPVDAPGARFPVRAFWRVEEPKWPLDALIATLHT